MLHKLEDPLPVTSQREQAAVFKAVNFTNQSAYALAVAIALAASCLVVASSTYAQQPNVVIVNLDDFGWKDLGVYGSQYSQTPNIDQLAAQGTRFTQYYSAAPICSPSRAGLFTGQYAARSGINSFIEASSGNLAKDNANSLSLSAPSMAKVFHDSGYATGHFGKWHLGGGRDVGYAVGTTAGTNVTAPRINDYGYDRAWTQMEGLANRIINVTDYGGNANGSPTRTSNYLNSLNQQSEARGTGGGQDQLVYLEREFNGTFMVNRAIDFINDSNAADPNKPFFMNVWLDETHTPHDPPAALKAKYNSLYPSLPAESRDYLAMIEYTDQQVGRLVSHIDNLGLAEETMIVVMADNGAVGVNANNIGSNGPFRGSKGSLFEGGFREPLVVRWTGNVAANRTDTQTVIWGPDMLPTLIDIAGLNAPAGVAFDGENMSTALVGGQSQTRTKSLFWNMNRGSEGTHSNPTSGGAGDGGEEVLAIRNGNWKLLLNAEGGAPELYNLANDLGESNNLAPQNPVLVNQLASEALAIRYSTPSRTVPDTATPIVRLKADDLKGLGNNAAISTWSDTATADTFNGTVTQSTAANRPRVQTNALNGKAVVSFDGDDALLSPQTNSLSNVGRGMTVFAVATSDTSGATAERLAQIGDRNGASREVIGLDVSSTPVDGGNGGAGLRFNDGSSLYDTPLANPGFHIVAWQVDEGQAYADAKMFVDGTLAANTFTGSSTNATSITSFSGNDLELLLGTGRNAPGTLLTSDSYSGQLAEFLVYNDQLSIGQINLVANYLSSEYGLPFAYNTNVSLVAVQGLTWTGTIANFDSSWNSGNGSGGPAGSSTNPFQGGKQDLYLGNNGTAQYANSTDTSAGTRLNSLRIGTAQGGLLVSGTAGNGTLTASGSKSLTIGSGLAPVGANPTGDLIVGENGHTGTLTWSSSGTLKVEGRFRIGEGGIGVVNQNAGIVTAGDVTGQLKFMAIGTGAGSHGEYNLYNGRLLPGGGITGSELRHIRVGFNGGNGALNVGDGSGAALSASVESRDDLYIGYDGGTASLTLQSDGQVLLSGDNAPFFVGYNANSVGIVTQFGGLFKSDGEFVIGQAGGEGSYSISGGTLRTANDTAAAFRIGRNGGKGTLRVSGTGSVLHPDTLTLGDGSTGTEGRIELIGNQASLTIATLENLASGASETLSWTAAAGGVTPLIVNGASGNNRVQLQDPAEVSANTGTNGSGNLRGNGIALELNLAAILNSTTLLLIDNRTTDAITGFFENALTNNLYEQGEQIYGTGFNGTVTISYIGGTGNDLSLTLAALLGDHNRDGHVDAADYVVWKKTGVNGPQGYTEWRNNYSASVPSAGSGVATATIPEPASWTTIVIGALILRLASRSRRSSTTQSELP